LLKGLINRGFGVIFVLKEKREKRKEKREKRK